MSSGKFCIDALGRGRPSCVLLRLLVSCNFLGKGNTCNFAQSHGLGDQSDHLTLLAHYILFGASFPVKFCTSCHTLCTF